MHLSPQLHLLSPGNNTLNLDEARKFFSSDFKLHDGSDLLFDCVDGRNDLSGRMGAFGGNLGEFILALHCVQLHQPVESIQVFDLMKDYLNCGLPLYFHSDDHHTKLVVNSLHQLGHHDVDPSNPRDNDKPVLLDYLSDPDYLGCGHIKAILYDAAYGADQCMAKESIRSFYKLLWNSHPRCHYEELQGQHQENGVVIVHSSDLSAVPTIRFRTSNNSVFVFHCDAVAILRYQTASFFADLFNLNRDVLFHDIEDMGQKWANLTLDVLAPGLSLFELDVEHEFEEECDTVMCQVAC
ncbi:hypothetical protein P9112_005976 [Eukaryota sp. TZLM1-RC]